MLKNDNTPLVSIVTPCYNGGKFLDNYFESIFNQTYSNIEIILVNDGSTDNSDSIIESYKERIDASNIKFQYLTKNNEGQMKAVQDGMLLTNGEFLTWPDIDDIMEPTYIEDKVRALNNNPDVDIIVSPSNIFSFEDAETKLGVAWGKKFNTKEELIDRFVEGKNAGYMPGSFMLRTSSFLKMYPEKRFYSELKTGVAIPLVFPFIYKGKAMYFDKPLYRYLIHANNQHTLNELRDYNYVEILYDNVIKDMNLLEEEELLIKRKVHIHCIQLKLGYAYRTGNKEDFRLHKKELIALKSFRKKDFVKGILLSLGIIVNKAQRN